MPHFQIIPKTFWFLLRLIKLLVKYGKYTISVIGELKKYIKTKNHGGCIFYFFNCPLMTTVLAHYLKELKEVMTTNTDKGKPKLQ